MVIANLISYILVLTGAINWGLSAIFQGPRAIGAIIVYSLIAAAALWLIISPILTNGALKLQGNRVIREEN